MKTKYTPLALALAAFIASPIAFASENGDDHTFTAKADLSLNVDADISISKNKVDVDIEKDFNYDEDVDIQVESVIHPNSYSRSVTNDSQRNLLNVGENENLDNNATATDSTLSNASGNIGVNIAAGDNNQQDNAAALSVADAEFTFGAADAQSHSSQDNEFNETFNSGVSNNAGLHDSALSRASGNIAVNAAAGNNNQQKNNLSIAVSTGGVSLAMVTSDQESDRNYTSNGGNVVTLTKSGEFSGGVVLRGTYEGQSDQIGDLYVDNWGAGSTGLPNHPTDGAFLGHSDFDSEAQGAQDLNEDGGALAFNEAGTIALAGQFSGSYSHSYDIIVPASNDASLSGSSLSGASGNIGVNVAAGTGNQQNNSLAVSLSTGIAGPAPGE